MSNVIQPQNRFPEFTTEWNKVPLKQVAKRQKEKNTENVHSFVLTNSATQGVVSQQDYFDKDIANQNNLAGYYIVETDDFVYNPRISVHAPVGPIKRNTLQTGVMSPLYTIFKFTDGDNDFFEYYFESTYWYKYLYSVANYGARHDRMNITNDDFEKLPIPLPHREEQKKIATFLTTVDKKITLLEEKKAQLEAYKQGMMQRLFPKKVGEQPELRFKDENGEVFRDWEEKRLGDVVEFITNGTSATQNDEKKGIMVTRIETISDGTINLEKVGYVETDKDLSEYRIKVGDILFSNINSVKHIGKIALINEDYDLYHGMNLLNIRVNQNNVSLFLFYLLSSDKYKKYFQRICNQAVSQASINQTDLKKTKMFVPVSKEQQKIADFLTSIDAKISGVDGEIEQMKEWKRGLLQRMFV